MIDKRVSILAIDAHAGDAEISAGLALAHHVNLGRKVAICHLTLGEKGHPRCSPSDYAKQKRDEAMAASEVIGAELYMLPYRDGELTANDEVKLQLCDVIRDCCPDVIITHWKESAQKDHMATSASVADAIIYAATSAFERMMPAHTTKALYYTENWEDYLNFTPELYIEITDDDVALWEKMVKKYALFRGEASKFPYIDYYKSLARVRGMEVYTQLATAFAVPEAQRKLRQKALAP